MFNYSPCGKSGKKRRLCFYPADSTFVFCDCVQHSGGLQTFSITLPTTGVQVSVYTEDNFHFTKRGGLTNDTTFVSTTVSNIYLARPACLSGRLAGYIFCGCFFSPLGKVAGRAIYFSLFLVVDIGATSSQELLDGSLPTFQ